MTHDGRSKGHPVGLHHHGILQSAPMDRGGWGRRRCGTWHHDCMGLLGGSRSGRSGHDPPREMSARRAQHTPRLRGFQNTLPGRSAEKQPLDAFESCDFARFCALMQAREGQFESAFACQPRRPARTNETGKVLQAWYGQKKVAQSASIPCIIRRRRACRPLCGSRRGRWCGARGSGGSHPGRKISGWQ